MANNNLVVNVSLHFTAYYITPRPDGEFVLWHGWLPSDNNFHYATFGGVNFQGEPVWVYQSTDIPDGSIILPVEIGEAMVRQAVEDWRKAHAHSGGVQS